MFLLKRTTALFAVILACVSIAFAQANAKVSGTVTDPNGAAVPGASVKLINQATKIESGTTTNEDGYFCGCLEVQRFVHRAGSGGHRPWRARTCARSGRRRGNGTGRDGGVAARRAAACQVASPLYEPP